MAKTTNLYIRLEPGLKEQTELVLGQLGIPGSNAVNIFLKQVVMQSTKHGEPPYTKLYVR